YNKVFGYYIEVSKANLRHVPPEYQRRQTLVGGERFTTPELQEYEFRVLHAQERQQELERALLRQVCAQVAAHGPRILETAAAVALVDVYCALAEVAARYGYVRPTIDEGNEIVIRDGRHPVVERMLPEGSFVPNDAYLAGHEAQVIVLTGPNMAGKSTYLRQVALTVLLAQIGSFVPAAEARVGLVDRIFSRVGALDDIAAGRSTFMVEMLETAAILHNASPRSLLLFDEIGRGTSTYDGMAIARAVVEFIHNRPEAAAKTLFATHYHELTDLASFLPRVRNYNVAVAEEEGRVVFLHRILPGGADRSYGVHVAQLAGLPRPVVLRAQELLEELEASRDRGGPSSRRREESPQLPLFAPDSELARELAKLDVDSLTPLEAITKLYQLKTRATEANDKGHFPLTSNRPASMLASRIERLPREGKPMTFAKATPVLPLPELAPQPESQTDAWDFGGADTQYGVHGLHTYLAAMIPQLARRLIDVYIPPHGSVLDPFCGGGAVPAEAIMAGRQATACDVNDLAVLMSKAKTTHIPRNDILAVTSAILDEARHFDGEPLSFRRSDYIDFWFKPYMLKPLTAIKVAIDRVLPDDCPLRTLFLTVFSATVRDVSLTRRNEIRLRRMSPKDVEAFRPDIFGRFTARAHYAASVVPQLPVGAAADVCKGNVLHLPFQDEEFHCIICSPPYGDERNGVPYVQFAKSMLLWLGFNREQILESKNETLGWSKENKKPPPSQTLHQYLAQISHKPQSAREAVAFYSDYLAALREMARVVSKTVIIVIGNRVLQNTVFDNAEITIELLNSLGVTLEDRFQRRLPTKRLPKMRQFGAAIDREDILVFNVKP
ncbi:MAG: DNA mismatch repair protein MutS, partial [Dehalococcoidia bacterium]